MLTDYFYFIWVKDLIRLVEGYYLWEYLGLFLGVENIYAYV